MTQDTIAQRPPTDNTPVEIWLEAGNTRAGFVPSEGFNCTALRVRRGDVWQPILAEPPSWEAVWARPSFYGSPLLGPYVYGAHDGALIYAGQRHALAHGKERRANHGLTRDYAWTVTEQHQANDEATLRAHLAIGGDEPEASARLGEFPYPLEIDVTYVLRPGVLVFRFAVTNTGAKTAPLGMGIHPYFTLPLVAGGSTGDLIVRGPLARLTDSGRFAANSCLGGYDADPTRFEQQVDRYIALAPSDRSILDILERTDTARQGESLDAEGASDPIWTMTDTAARLDIAIGASADFRYVGQFIPPSRAVLSPVVSTNRPDVFGLSAEGVDAGLIELAAGATWRGWCVISVLV